MKRLTLRRGALALALVFAVGATAASGSDSASDGKKDGGDVSKGIGSSDASGDVSDAKIIRESDVIASVYAEVKVTNNSSKRSDYFVTLVAESPDGKTRYDDTMVSVMGLDPGQSVTEKSIFLKDEIPEDAVLKVKEVQRTASL